MEKFYIASSFKNTEAVQYVAEQLKEKGWCHTYDWTENAAVKEQRAFTIDELIEIGQQEKAAITESDFVVILLPGGKGTHIEMGIALGLGKKIYLYSEDGAVDRLEMTSTFYHLPEVEKCFGSLDELLEKINDAKVFWS